jgi:NADPH:quinone reductase-like Zn-dependent oxidoreductase
MGSPADFAGMAAMTAEKRLVPAVDQVFALADAEQAMRRMAAGAQFGKLVLKCG